MLLAALFLLCPQAPSTPTAAPWRALPPIRAAVITGANNHEWQWTSKEIGTALTETGRFVATVENDPAAFLPTITDLFAKKELDVVVLDYNGPRWGAAADSAFLDAVRAGLGVCVVHAANNAFPGWAEYEQMVGLLWRDGTGHGAYHPFSVRVTDHDHPVTAGMTDLRLHPDELYHRLVPGAGSNHRVLMAAFSDSKQGGTGTDEPMATAGSFGKGRIFHTPLGHVWTGVPATRATWADPQLRLLVARGTEWAASGTVTIPPVPLNRLSPDEEKEGFVSLFDGLRITEWRTYKGDAPPPKGWVVRDAAMVHEANGGGGDLVSAQEYGDFDFRFSFRVSSKGNSGVMWHVTEENDTTYMSGPEYQVLDDLGAKPPAKHGTGALYDLVAPEAPALRPAGAWNEGRIVIEKGRVRHWLNGALVVDAPCAGASWDAMIGKSKFRDWPFGKATKGRFALQDHGDEVAFRNLRVRAL